MPGETVAELRRKVFVGELPEDFLRLTLPSSSTDEPLDIAAGNPHIQVQQQLAFVPPNTRGRISVTIIEGNLVKNYGLVRMDPYCRLRVGNSIFETQTKISGGRNPLWNRIVHAYLPNNVESVYLQIFDERAFSADECVAWAHVLLPPAIFNGETIDDWYPLSGQQGEGKEGMVHLIFTFVPVEEQYQIPEVQMAQMQQMGAGAGQQPGVTELVISEEDIKALKEMFPNVDDEVIKCILEERRGDKDAAVTALLELT